MRAGKAAAPELIEHLGPPLPPRTVCGRRSEATAQSLGAGRCKRERGTTAPPRPWHRKTPWAACAPHSSGRSARPTRMQAWRGGEDKLGQAAHAGRPTVCRTTGRPPPIGRAQTRRTCDHMPKPSPSTVHTRASRPRPRRARARAATPPTHEHTSAHLAGRDDEDFAPFLHQVPYGVLEPVHVPANIGEGGGLHQHANAAGGLPAGGQSPRGWQRAARPRAETCTHAQRHR